MDSEPRNPHSDEKFVQIAAVKGSILTILYALDVSGIVWMYDIHAGAWKAKSNKRLD